MTALRDAIVRASQADRVIVGRPISFNDEMIAALRSGRKTQTRRVIGEGVKPSTKFGRPGERLWVRQRWAEITDSHGVTTCVFSTDGPPKSDHRIVWRPSYTMPRRACRTLLEITSIRTERLSRITERDAAAEGFDAATSEFLTAKDWFFDLWTRIATTPGTRVEDDPRVCVIAFRVIN